MRWTTVGGSDAITHARGDFCGRSSRSRRMLRSAARSNPSADSVARETSVALLVGRQDREAGERGSERQLLALERHPRGEDGVLELVVLLGELGGDEPTLAGLTQPVEPFARLAVRGRLLVAERAELVTAEEVGVTRDDRRLLRHLFLAAADRSSLLRSVVEVALELLLELRRAADRGRRHLEDSIRL